MSYSGGCSNSIPAYIDCGSGQRLPRPEELGFKTTKRMPDKLKEIKITAMDAGYIVNVGCQTFAIESKQSLITKLSAYINDPDNVEKAWMQDHKLPKK